MFRLLREVIGSMIGLLIAAFFIFMIGAAAYHAIVEHDTLLGIGWTIIHDFAEAVSGITVTSVVIALFAMALFYLGYRIETVYVAVGDLAGKLEDLSEKVDELTHEVERLPEEISVDDHDE